MPNPFLLLYHILRNTKRLSLPWLTGADQAERCLFGEIPRTGDAAQQSMQSFLGRKLLFLNLGEARVDAAEQVLRPAVGLALPVDPLRLPGNADQHFHLQFGQRAAKRRIFSLSKARFPL